MSIVLMTFDAFKLERRLAIIIRLGTQAGAAGDSNVFFQKLFNFPNILVRIHKLKAIVFSNKGRLLPGERSFCERMSPHVFFQVGLRLVHVQAIKIHGCSFTALIV